MPKNILAKAPLHQYFTCKEVFCSAGKVKIKVSDNIKLEIRAYSIQVDELQEELSKHCMNTGTSAEFEINTPKSRFRSIEPAVLVAIVAASATALGSLITGLLAIAKQRETKKIVICWKDNRIEVPTDLIDNEKNDRLSDLLEKIKEMDHPQVLF